MKLLYKVLYNKRRSTFHACIGTGLFCFVLFMNLIVTLEIVLRKKLVITAMRPIGGLLVLGFAVLIYYTIGKRMDNELLDSGKFEVRRRDKLAIELSFLLSIALVMALAIFRMKVLHI